MKTVAEKILINSLPEKVFATLDDLGITGMHMSQSSMMMMGSKLHLEYLTEHHIGLGSRYRWTGKMMGIKMDFTVVVTKWKKGVEKVWETIGPAKMIIYSWYRMHLIISKVGDKTLVELSITYKPPEGWFTKFISFVFAGWYCKWCLRSMLNDTKQILEPGKLKSRKIKQSIM